MENGEIIIYEDAQGQTKLDVRLQGDTVWLNQAQMAELFQTTPQNITLHIGNIFKERELDSTSTCKEFLQVRLEGKRSVKRIQKFYNLDVIISVGYRVKSLRGTQFRIWANKILKEYLLKGYAINELRIKDKYEELKSVVTILGNTIRNQELSSQQAKDLMAVVTDYVYALDTLDRYDYSQLEVSNVTTKEAFKATYDGAMEVISSLKGKFGSSDLFGNEKDGSFKSSIGQIYQTFGGQDCYPSIEEKAAMLLYLVTKNHSFSDGNKRIAATLFLWFMDNNGILYTEDGTKRISDGTLVALTLMIAESRTEEMDTMVKVVVNLINKNIGF